MIELIVVIVILGILAAVALPRFIDLSSESRAAAFEGVVGGARSAMSLNYVACSTVGHVATPGKCQTVDDCDKTDGLISGGLPDGYTVQSQALAGPNGTADACTMVNAAGETRSFTGIAAGQ